MEKKRVSTLSLCLSLLSKKQATLGKTLRVNTPTNNIHLHKTLVTQIL